MKLSHRSPHLPRPLLAGSFGLALMLVIVTGCSSSGGTTSNQSATTTQAAPDTVPAGQPSNTASSTATSASGNAGAVSSAAVPSSSSGGALTSEAAIPTEVIPSQQVDADIQKQVPDKFRSAGSIRVATSADYPPNEFVNDGTLVGVHADLAKALGQVMGVDFKFTITPFDSIIPGLQAGRYDAAMSSAAITKARMEVVDFVSDIHGADALLVRADDTHTFAKPTDMCGALMGVASGTYEAGVAKDQSKACADAGQPAIKINTYPSQLEAVLALSGKRVDVVIAAGSALGYIAKGEPGKFKLAGQSIFPQGTNGIELAKNNGLGPAVTAALNLLITNGTYGQILKKWGVESYGVTKAEFNPTPAS